MNKSILSAIALAFAFAMPASAQDGLLKKYAQRLSTPRHYVCYRTNEKIKIDGKLNEKSWAKAADTESFVDISGDGFPKPIYDTKARMMWDSAILSSITTMTLRCSSTLQATDSVISRLRTTHVALCSTLCLIVPIVRAATSTSSGIVLD